MGLRRRGGVWWVRYSRNGRRFEESSGSEKKGEALTLLKLREGESAKGVPVTPQIGRLTFDAAVADVVSDYRVNGRKSLAHVERRIRLHLAPYFGGRRMATITTPEIRAFVAARQQAIEQEDGTTTPGASNAEINRELAIIKRAFKLSMQAKQLFTMPHVPMLRENNVRQGFFEQDDFEAVRAALPEPVRGVLTLAYLTGWRIRSEVLPLTWAQVDRKANIIRLDPGLTKGGEGRTLPYDLLPELAEVIETQWKDRERVQRAGRLVAHVFHRDGKPIKSFLKVWEKACLAAGCPDRIPHDLRRTAVRNLVRAGVSERTAMQITGHKTRSVFDRYDIVSEIDLREGLGRLSSVQTPSAPRRGVVRQIR